MNSKFFFSRHKKNGEYINVSKEVEVVLGYTPNELIGQMTNKYFHPNDLLRITKTHLETLNKGMQIVIWRVYSKKFNKYIWVKTYSSFYASNPDEILCLTVKLKCLKILMFKLKNIHLLWNEINFIK